MTHDTTFASGHGLSEPSNHLWQPIDADARPHQLPLKGVGRRWWK